MSRGSQGNGPITELRIQHVSVDHVGSYAHLAALRRDRYTPVVGLNSDYSHLRRDRYTPVVGLNSDYSHLPLTRSDNYAHAVHMLDGNAALAGVPGINQPIIVDTQNQSSKFEWSDFSAGFLAGIAGVIVGHPFDTIKVRQQVKGDKYSSLWKCMTRTLRHEGIGGFYKGLLFPLLSEGGRNCLFFGVYERLKAEEEEGTSISYKSVACAAAVGGGIQAIPATPIELTKIKLQHQTEKLKTARRYRGPMHCMSDIYRNHGISRCFRGVIPCVLRDVSGFAAYMTSYEYLCRCFEPQGPSYCSIPVLLFTGGTAGAFSWFINLPIDYIKSRMQADCLSKPRFKNTATCARVVLQEEGMRVLYRGLPAVLMRAFILNAVTLSVYSSTRFHLQNMRKEAEVTSL